MEIKNIRREPKSIKAVYLTREAQDQIWDLRTMQRKKGNDNTSNSQIVCEAVNYYYNSCRQEYDKN